MYFCTDQKQPHRRKFIGIALWLAVVVSVPLVQPLIDNTGTLNSASTNSCMIGRATKPWITEGADPNYLGFSAGYSGKEVDAFLNANSRCRCETTIW